MTLSPRARRLLLLAAKIACALGVLAYFAAIMRWRLVGAWTDFSVDGDQHQSIGHYWRYHVDGAMPAGHLLTDYAFAYHSTPLWWAVMATLSTFIEPLHAAKVMACVVYLLAAVAAGLVVGRRSHWLLGFAVAALVLRSPDLPEQVTGGMARSLGPALFLFFLWALYERRHRLLLLLLVVQAATYPSVVIPCGLVYGVFCLVKGPMKERVRRCGELFVAGLLVLSLGKAQDLKAPEWWGPLVTYDEAATMQAWRRGGRFEEVPHKPFDRLLMGNLERAHKKLGDTFAPSALEKLVDRRRHETLLATPVALALLLAAAGLLRRRLSRRSVAPDDALPQARFPWEHVWLFCGALAAYWLVRLVSFKLFLPSRQLGFTIQYLVVTGLPLLVWFGALRLWPGRRKLAVLVVALLTIVPAFALRGDGLTRTRAGYREHNRDIKLYQAVRGLPLDEEIACDAYYCELMMTLGQHAPYAARNLTHPLRKGYFEEAERRFVEMHRVLYATDVATIRNFVEKERVRYIAYDRASARDMTKRGYRPVTGRIKRIYDSGKNKPRLLLHPPKEALVFRDGPRVIVDLSKWPDEPPPSSAESPAAPEATP